MKVEYSINGTDYSEQRYAVVVPANTANRSYWIRISIVDKAKSASFTGDFNWLLSGCDPQSKEYLSLESVEMQATGTTGEYKVSFAEGGEYVGNLVFPSEVNGSPVTTIADNSSITQEEKNQVTSVYVPDSVTTIGGSAFSGYQNLQTVTFEQNETSSSASAQSGTGLTAINQYAFANCTSLKEFIIPNTVTSMAEGSFTGCTSLTSIVIPSSVTAIEFAAFANCTGLTKVEFLGNTVLNGDYSGSMPPVFYGCSNLKTFKFNAETLNENIVSELTSLNTEHGTKFNIILGKNFTGDIYMNVLGPAIASLTIEEGNTTYQTINDCLIDTKYKILIKGSATSVIPTDGSVTSIGAYAFQGCTGLTSIVIPDTITYIDMFAFRNCTELTNITIPASVTGLGLSYARGGVFEGCTSLTSAVFENPNGWTCTLYGWNSETESVVDETVSIDATELSNPQTAAALLTREPKYDTLSYIWSHS